jgi:hypothetical protein
MGREDWTGREWVQMSTKITFLIFLSFLLNKAGITVSHFTCAPSHTMTFEQFSTIWGKGHGNLYTREEGSTACAVVNPPTNWLLVLRRIFFWFQKHLSPQLNDNCTCGAIPFPLYLISLVMLFDSFTWGTPLYKFCLITVENILRWTKSQLYNFLTTTNAVPFSFPMYIDFPGLGKQKVSFKISPLKTGPA